jgi:ribosomal protein S1
MSDDETVDPEKLFQLNEKKQFKVLDIDTDSRKIALSLKEAKTSSKSKTTTKVAKPAVKTIKPKK